MPFTVEQLPTINAALNGLAAILLVCGYVLIKAKREQAHKRAMLAAFGTSVLFLACYLVYHWQIGGGKKFVGPPLIRTGYLLMLFSHIVLAAAVPFLALATIYTGYRDRRLAHRKLAKCLYVFFPGPADSSTIETPGASTAALPEGRMTL
jgi:putative membrane protein